MKIGGAVALVIGGNHGIGRRIVDGLGARGARKVHAAVRNTANLQGVVSPRGVVLPVQTKIQRVFDEPRHARG